MKRENNRPQRICTGPHISHIAWTLREYNFKGIFLGLKNKIVLYSEFRRLTFTCCMSVIANKETNLEHQMYFTVMLRQPLTTTDNVV